MSKLLVGVMVGAVLGVFDGLSALVSAPETRPEILGIVIGSTLKGVIAGLAAGAFARKVRSVPLGLLFGLCVGGGLAFLVTLANPYFWEIFLPGSLVGLAVGWTTQRYGLVPARS